MADSNTDTAIQQWLSGEISLDQLKSKIPEEEALKYAQIIEEVDQWTPEVNSLALPTLPKKNQKKESKIVSINRSTWLSVAASIMLISLVIFWLSDGDSEVVRFADNGKIETVDFPDQGSIVKLAVGSSIRWDMQNWEDDRRYSQFEGTGFFEVEKGGEFKVSLTEGSVTVLGTSFEIDTYEEGFAVACYSGEVRVADNNGKTRTLRAGKRVSFENRTLNEVQSFDESKTPAWISTGTSTFENSPLTQVIARLERQFDITIETSGINLERKFTGSFKNDDVDKALLTVFAALNIKFEKKNNQVTLSE